MKTALRIYLFFIYILFANCTFSNNSIDSTIEKPEIIIITSCNSDSKYNYDSIKEFIQVYTSIGGNGKIAVENMNNTKLIHTNQWVDTVEQLINKHKDVKLLVLLGGEAWNGYLFSKNENIKKIPAICAMASRYGFSLPKEGEDISTYMPESIDLIEVMKNSNVKACYAYDYKVTENIRIAQYFYPNLDKLVFLSDNTYSGLTQQTQFVKSISKDFPNIETMLIDGRNTSMPEAVEKIKSISTTNTAMMIGIWRFDSDNIYYIDNASYAFRAANPQLPLFSITSTTLGYWAVGGYSPVYDGVPEKIANKAHQILLINKDTPQELIILPNKCRFDYNKLEQFDLLDKELPEDSDIRNKPLKFRELYRKQVQIICVIFICLFVALVISLLYFNKTRILKNKLQLLANQLQHEKVMLEASEHELLISKEKIEKASQLQSTFVSNISHEIRTPLNAIVGFSSLFVNSLNGNDEQKEYAQIIQSNSDLLLQLITDVLDISRLESDKLHFNYEECTIVPYCQNIISFTNLNKKNNAEIVYTHNIHEDFKLYTDPLRLQQVVTNLLNNALKFTPEDGIITLNLFINDDKTNFYISVKDTGLGIPKEKHKSVFDRFEKLDEFVQGTGLGLSICKQIINQMGGEIWIDENYNEGACFIFSHPLYQ